MITGLTLMLGHNSSHSQESLFSYHVSLDRRLSPHHPLRAIHAALDLSFIIPAVRPFYGRSGHVALDPRVIVKLMFLLFYYSSIIYPQRTGTDGTTVLSAGFSVVSGF